MYCKVVNRGLPCLIFVFCLLYKESLLLSIYIYMYIIYVCVIHTTVTEVYILCVCLLCSMSVD